MILKICKVWALSMALSATLIAEDMIITEPFIPEDAPAMPQTDTVIVAQKNESEDSLAVVKDDESASAAQQIKEACPAEKIEKSEKKSCVKNSRYHENAIEMSLQSACLFSVFHESSYTFSPQILTVAWQLDNVGNEGWRRGNTAFLFSAFYSPVIHGWENYMIGSAWGPQYNFVQPGWKFVPYVNARVGFLFTDSVDNNVCRGAQGQDYCFTFFVSAGCRYDIDDHWSLALEGAYQHISNGGLSEPSHSNEGLETIGPSVSMIYKF